MTAVRVEDGLLHVGEETLPFIAGEIQFWRMDPDTWEPAIRAAQAAGIAIVSTYLSWRRHEPTRGQVSFMGDDDPALNVVRFLEICAEVGVYVQLKPGPWICAEEPGGGYPDWLLSDTSLLATDDAGEPVVGYNPPFQHPVPSYSSEGYRESVNRWFAAMWDALRHQVYPHGPVIALQLDNEPSVCFQDSLYGADYSDSAIEAFRRWLRVRYGDDRHFQSAWETTEPISAASAPRRPAQSTEPAPIVRLRDWMLFKTWATGDYLASLRSMHEDLGGGDLLYTVNLVTHPVHDVPVSHAAIRAATNAAVGEDHYYIPPLDTKDIHRLARSAATARAADEPLPWVPELQAGIWRSPGEIVEYPDPTPLEQEVWWGAAVALGFAGFNLYMLANRENWEHAPLTETGARSPFFAPISGLKAVAGAGRGALTAAPMPSVVVAWHREDAYAAYAVTGTSRLPDVAWHSAAEADPYHQWDRTLEQLTARGVLYELWETTADFPDLPVEIPLLVPPRSGLSDRVVGSLELSGRLVHRMADVEATPWELVTARAPKALVHGEPVDRTIVTLRQGEAHLFLHLVHWGQGAHEATLHLPGIHGGVLQDVRDGSTTQISGSVALIELAPGHRIYLIQA